MARLAAALALLLLLAAPPRSPAWYKPAGPRHYSVGRAAGLLSGFRAAGRGPPRAGLRTLAVCVRDVAPNLQSCERLPDGGAGTPGTPATFQCKADVFLSLRASDCGGA